MTHGNLPVGELISASAQYCPGVHRVGAEEPRGQLYCCSYLKQTW